MSLQVIHFDAPFVVFFGDIREEGDAKTGLGLVQWRGLDCLGQIRLPGCSVDAGVADLTIAETKSRGARSLIVGVAPVGGQIPQHWVASLCEAARTGIDIVAGLHIPLSSLSGLSEAAAAGRARLIDVRVPPPGIPVGSGKKRTGRRLLTVGTDCACGKKYTALAINAQLRERGIPSDFRASGQTGIMIAGCGIPIDAVVADFLTGAAEWLSPEAAPNHWDIVEGQGSLFHPGYLQVTVGLLVGTQPDAFVVCHNPLQHEIAEWPGFPLPSINALIERTVTIGKLTNRAIRCVGISLNTSKLPKSERQKVLSEYSAQTGLPCVNPLIEGTAAIVDQLLRQFPQ